jgi:hypothetical protein
MGILVRLVWASVARKLALLCVAGLLVAAAAPVSEYQLKAVFLFNFAQFVEWPSSAFAQTNAPFVIGVLGKDPFGSNLDDVVRGETVNGHPLAVQRYASIGDVGDCQILFIPATELAHVGELLAKLKGRSILTVTDAEEAPQRGVIIGLITQDRQIRLRIDLQAAKVASLTISSKLLRPAEIVGTARS